LQWAERRAATAVSAARKFAAVAKPASKQQSRLASRTELSVLVRKKQQLFTAQCVQETLHCKISLYVTLAARRQRDLAPRPAAGFYADRLQRITIVR